jgi:hypothetical protein
MRLRAGVWPLALALELTFAACGGGKDGSSSPSSPTPAAPTVTAISPASGSTAGGTAVTIAGTNFAAGTTVTIGGVAATSVQLPSVTTITATTGARAAGAADVVVTVAGRTVTLAGAFTYRDIPVTVTVQKYLSPGGYKGSYTKAGIGGQALPVCLSEFGMAGIDTQRIAVRQTVVDGHVGNYIAASKAGGCASVTPVEDSTVAAYAFASDDYALMDGNRLGNTQTHPKAATMFIDPANPSTAFEVQAVDNLIALYSAALRQSGSAAGKLSRVEGSGDIRIRFGIGSDCGSHDGVNNNSIVINRAVCDSMNRKIQGVLIEELFEILNHVGDIDGPGSLVREPDDATLNQRGANFTNYTYLMSSKNWSATTATAAALSVASSPGIHETGTLESSGLRPLGMYLARLKR